MGKLNVSYPGDETDASVQRGEFSPTFVFTNSVFVDPFLKFGPGQGQGPGPWAHGPVGPWAHGPVAPWARGPCGPMALWARGPVGPGRARARARAVCADVPRRIFGLGQPHRQRTQG